jgi:hypothetical protein
MNTNSKSPLAEGVSRPFERQQGSRPGRSVGSLALIACAIGTVVILCAGCKRPAAPAAPKPVTPVSPMRVCLDDSSSTRGVPFRMETRVGFGPTMVRPAWARWIPQFPHKRLKLRVQFLNGDLATRARVQKYANEWTNYAFVTFVYVNDPSAEIRIWFANDGFCQTKVGSTAVNFSGPTMHYGWLGPSTPDPEFRRTVLHEFGHALGLVHEHQSPSSGVIKWNPTAVYDECWRLHHWTTAQVDENILHRYSTNETQFSTFDPASIMIYPIPKSWTTDGYTVNWNDDLSATDRSYVAVLYPK